LPKKEKKHNKLNYGRHPLRLRKRPSHEKDSEDPDLSESVGVRDRRESKPAQNRRLGLIPFSSRCTMASRR
jgi:hypothetical protein